MGVGRYLEMVYKQLMYILGGLALRPIVNNDGINFHDQQKIFSRKLWIVFHKGIGMYIYLYIYIHMQIKSAMQIMQYANN